MSKDGKKYNLTIARAYRTKVGYWSLPIGPEEYDAIQKMEQGGRIVFKENLNRKNDKSPHAWIEYMSKEEAEAFSNRGKKDDDSDDI